MQTRLTISLALGTIIVSSVALLAGYPVQGQPRVFC